MNKVQVKIINKSNNPLPKYATEGSAGFDLQANITEDYYNTYISTACITDPDTKSFRLFYDRVTKIPTGLFVEVPEGYELQIRPRSGLAFKHGINVINSPGTIDSDYRGEIIVGLYLDAYDMNEISFKHGDKIAQAVLAPVTQAEFVEVEELSETDRGEGGFGSTGK